jgi:thiol-disulfide isomerase/thioredoxin
VSPRAALSVAALALLAGACSKNEATTVPQAPATTITADPGNRPPPTGPQAGTSTTTGAQTPQAPATGAATPAGTSAKLRIVEPPEEGDVLTIVRAQRVKAVEEKRIFVVYIGAPWCPPCVRFHDAIKSHELDEKLANYTIMQFDLDRDGQRLLAAGYGSKFIPYFVLPGPDGKKTQAFEVKILKKEEALREVVDGLLKWNVK